MAQAQQHTPYSLAACSVVEVWVWLRSAAHYQFQNVTISVGAITPGTATICASNLTGTAPSNSTGATKVPCTAANGTSVQYVYLAAFNSGQVLAIQEILVLRDGRWGSIP